MNQVAQAAAAQAEPDADLAQWRARVRGTNINETSLLATDYLNHFNEVVMLIEMIADMPECLDDVREWRPKSYKQHFADSGFSEKQLAIAAYDHAPDEFRMPLEETIGRLDRLVAVSIDRVATALAADNMDAIQHTAGRASRDLQRLVEIAGAIINGAAPTIGQSEIDAMFAD